LGKQTPPRWNRPFDELLYICFIGCRKEQGEVSSTLQKARYTESQPVEEVVYHAVARLLIKIVLKQVLSVFQRYQLRVDQMPFPVERVM